MQEAYVPPVQLDKSESNWVSKRRKKNMEPYYILELEQNDFEKREKKNLAYIYLKLNSLKVRVQF